MRYRRSQTGIKRSGRRSRPRESWLCQWSCSGQYLLGIRQSRHRTAYEDWLAQQLKRMVLLPVRGDTARRYAALRMELKEAGKPIPSNDLWIAAIAQECGAKLVTRDPHFDVIPELRVVMGRR